MILPVVKLLTARDCSPGQLHNLHAASLLHRDSIKAERSKFIDQYGSAPAGLLPAIQYKGGLSRPRKATGQTGSGHFRVYRYDGAIG